MTVKALAEHCGWQLLAGETAQNREVTDCCIGDLLSWVMAHARANSVWLTVMGNINAVAVATLTGISAIVLAEGATLDDDAKQAANEHGVAIYSCTENLYEAAVRVYEALK